VGDTGVDDGQDATFNHLLHINACRGSSEIEYRYTVRLAHGVGMVGAGLVKPPENAFRDALVAFAEKYAR